MNGAVLPFDVELSDEEAMKKEIVVQRVAPEEADALYYIKLVSAVLVFLVGVGGLIASLAVPETFARPYAITTMFRTGALSPVDGLSSIEPQIIGTVNAALVASSLAILAFFGYALVLFLHSQEMAQISGGSNPFIWIFSFFWQPLLFLLFALVAGVSELFLLIVLSFGLPIFWLREFYNADLLNSYSYRRSVFVATRSGQSAWPWLFLAFVLLALLLYYVTVLVYLGFFFGDTTAPPPSALLAIPIGGMVLLYGVFVIIVALHRAALWPSSMYRRDVLLYLISLALILFTTIGSLAIFAFT